MSAEVRLQFYDADIELSNTLDLLEAVAAEGNPEVVRKVRTMVMDAMEKTYELKYLLKELEGFDASVRTKRPD